MRLWHYALIPKLPRQQLLGQHRECCALRGMGWGRKHSTVDYVFEYSPKMLFDYHMLVINEMVKRGYKVSGEWLLEGYRGKRLRAYFETLYESEFPTYPEHNAEYFAECIENLAGKGIFVV